MSYARALGAPRAVLGTRRACPRRMVCAAARAGASTSSKNFAAGFDVGTQGTKCILFDLDAHTVAGRGSYAYDLLPHPSRPNAAEQDPETWMDGIRDTLKQALREANADASAIVSVAVSGQQHGMVALDAAGSVVRPAKLWCDTESAPQAASISESEAFGGWPMAASFTASKVAWMRDEEPENFARTETVLLPRDYVNFRLTGAVATEAGDASGSGVFDLNTRMYDESQCDAVDGRLLEMLPKDVLPPDSKVGVVTRAAADRTGLPVGCPVATGSGDNACAAIGVGATRPGRLVVSLGTSGTLFGASDVPVFDVTGAIAPFCDALGGYLPLLCTLNCTRVVEEARAWASYGTVENAEQSSHASLEKRAMFIPPGCEGVRFLPYLVGERTPNWPEATGALLGLRPGSLQDPATAYRAAMEGATYALRGGASRLTELGLAPAHELVCVGGGSKSKLWRQIVADVFDAAVVRPAEPESAALGAAKNAAALAEKTATIVYVDQFPPQFEPTRETPASRDVVSSYASEYQRFVEQSRALFGSR
jgi:xylulokinase